MIDIKDILDGFEKRISLWAAPTDDTDLALIAQTAIEGDMSVVSVVPDAVGTIWPWLEGYCIKIATRFYPVLRGRVLAANAMSDLAQRINTAFKAGANIAQVFVSMSELPRLVSELGPIRDDLFFNRELSVGVDINEIGPYDWDMVFDSLNKINASSLILALPKYSGDKSDFVGRVYACLNAWGAFGGALYFACGANVVPMSNAARLVLGMRPEIASRVHFFVPC